MRLLINFIKRLIINIYIYITVIIEKYSLLKVPELTISNLRNGDLCRSFYFKSS